MQKHSPAEPPFAPLVRAELDVLKKHLGRYPLRPINIGGISSTDRKHQNTLMLENDANVLSAFTAKFHDAFSKAPASFEGWEPLALDYLHDLFNKIGGAYGQEPSTTEIDTIQENALLAFVTLNVVWPIHKQTRDQLLITRTIKNIAENVTAINYIIKELKSVSASAEKSHDVLANAQSHFHNHGKWGRMQRAPIRWMRSRSIKRVCVARLVEDRFIVGNKETCSQMYTHADIILALPRIFQNPSQVQDTVLVPVKVLGHLLARARHDARLNFDISRQFHHMCYLIATRLLLLWPITTQTRAQVSVCSPLYRYALAWEDGSVLSPLHKEDRQQSSAVPNSPPKVANRESPQSAAVPNSPPEVANRESPQTSESAVSRGTSAVSAHVDEPRQETNEKQADNVAPSSEKPEQVPNVVMTQTMRASYLRWLRKSVEAVKLKRIYIASGMWNTQQDATNEVAAILHQQAPKTFLRNTTSLDEWEERLSNGAIFRIVWALQHNATQPKRMGALSRNTSPHLRKIRNVRIYGPATLKQKGRKRSTKQVTAYGLKGHPAVDKLYPIHADTIAPADEPKKTMANGMPSPFPPALSQELNKKLAERKERMAEQENQMAEQENQSVEQENQKAEQEKQMAEQRQNYNSKMHQQFVNKALEGAKTTRPSQVKRASFNIKGGASSVRKRARVI